MSDWRTSRDARSRIVKKALIVETLREDADRLADDSLKLNYRFPAACTLSGESTPCCANAFTILYGISSKSRVDYGNLVVKGEAICQSEVSEFKTAQGEARRHHALLWMKKEFQLICDILPTSDYTKKDYHLPKCISKVSVFKDYETYMRQLHDRQEIPEFVPLARSTFLMLWAKEYPYVTIPEHTAFTVCDICGDLHDRILSASKKRDYKTLTMLKVARRQHLDFIAEERLGYRERQQLARDFPEEYECLTADGMDQSKMKGPHFASCSKRKYCFP